MFDGNGFVSGRVRERELERKLRREWNVLVSKREFERGLGFLAWLVVGLRVGIHPHVHMYGKLRESEARKTKQMRLLCEWGTLPKQKVLLWLLVLFGPLSLSVRHVS